MKKSTFVLLWLGFFLWSTCAMGQVRSIQVNFSPNGGCTDAILQQINQARDEILIQAYAFTSKPIARALIAAEKRGVKITAVLDKSNQTRRYSAATFLKKVGISVFIDDQHAIAHNKIMIIDNRVVVTGSFNFTMAAETKNAENLLIMEDMPELTQSYRKNFQEHLKHSVSYRRVEDGEIF